MDIYKCPISEMSKYFPEKMQRCDHNWNLRSPDQKNNFHFVTITFFWKHVFLVFPIFGHFWIFVFSNTKNEKKRQKYFNYEIHMYYHLENQRFIICCVTITFVRNKNQHKKRHFSWLRNRKYLTYIYSYYHLSIKNNINN